jgi:hypothetical protein
MARILENAKDPVNDPIVSQPEEGRTVVYPPPPPDVGDRFIKVMIYPVDGEGGSVPLGYGEYPRIERPRGVEVVIPEHYKASLESKVPSFRHINMKFPDPQTGNVYREVPYTIMRHPYQIVGPATKEEWLADQERYRVRKR